MRHIINSQGFRGLGAVNVTRQPLTMCPDNADCSGPIVRDRVPIAPVTGSTNGTMPGETQAPTGMQSPLVGQTVIPQTPVLTLAPPVMPTLPASACSSGQTYIPPGGSFTTGLMAGQITSTGACEDAAPASGSVFALFGDTSTFTIGSVQIGTTTALVVIAAFFVFGSKN